MVAVIERGALPTQTEFHEAIARRADRWYSACLRITRDRELAEDAVQDALLSAWRKRHQYQRDAQLETWIHRIAVNAALQLVRRQRPYVFETLDTDIADDGESPQQDLEDSDLGNALAAALHHLTDIERVCFVLKHLEQWRLTEIADELGTNVGGVKQALFRGVKKLRVTMAQLRSKAS
ncbi:MAG TPA: RNA polymerase sigma factor [Woeseiaceae bacterium]|nr:RNA polymerase sigma factor [Woeseiaceae bacterium]